MFEWISDNRANIALVIIIGLLIAFVWSIRTGLKETRLRAKDEVFGDPERTRGGWYWAVCGRKTPVAAAQQLGSRGSTHG